jgi:3-carboxy-cis,cis-muconate cycloisomerase
MRPSSSSSDGLFAAVAARGPVAREVAPEAWLRALLDTEAALASATAAAGLVAEQDARAVVSACADTSAYDLAELAEAAASGGNPVIPLVRAIERVAGPGGTAVHNGATSQDVLDTAMVLVAQRAVRALAADLEATVTVAAALARAHRDTVLPARTLLQQAVPTTFGLKAAGWAVALDAAGARLSALRLPVQLGGAAGTLASYGGAGREVTVALARDLGLAVPTLPWHTARIPVADLAGALGTTAGVAGKVALDVVLLAQTEVGEVHERGGRGGSSAMPHKQNPVAAVQARASARRAPGLVATLLSCMEQEHERAAGAWHAEWVPMGDLLRTTGSAVAWLRTSLESLEVQPERMRANLVSSSADMAAEPVAAALTAALGRAAAHDLVASTLRRAHADGTPVRDALLAECEIAAVLSADQLDVLVDPERQVGDAPALVDAALAALAASRS